MYLFYEYITCICFFNLILKFTYYVKNIQRKILGRSVLIKYNMYIRLKDSNIKYNYLHHIYAMCFIKETYDKFFKQNHS